MTPPPPAKLGPCDAKQSHAGHGTLEPKAWHLPAASKAWATASSPGKLGGRVHRFPMRNGGEERVPWWGVQDLSPVPESSTPKSLPGDKKSLDPECHAE